MISDFSTSSGDVVKILNSSVDTYGEVLGAASQNGADTVIDLGLGDTITLLNVDMTTLQSDDFAFV